MLVSQSCPTLCDPMDCSPAGSRVHEIFQARILGRLPATREAQSCFYCNLTKRAAYWRPTWTPAFCHYLQQAWEGISPQKSWGLEGWEDFQDAGSESQDASSDLPALCSGRLGFLVKMNKPSLAHRVLCRSSHMKKGEALIDCKV